MTPKQVLKKELRDYKKKLGYINHNLKISTLGEDEKMLLIKLRKSTENKIIQFTEAIRDIDF